MANNFPVFDKDGVSRTIKTTDNATVHTPHHNVDTLASGASVDIGAVADAAVVTDTTGSLSGKLRGLVKWAFERMPAALGQGTMAQSLPVVIASNQTGVPLAASAAMIGGVRADGPFHVPVEKVVSSSDLSGGAVDLTDAPTVGQKVILDDLVVSADTAMRVEIREETSGTVRLAFYLPVNGTFTFSPTNKLRHPVTNKKWQIITSVSGNIRAWASWHSEA